MGAQKGLASFSPELLGSLVWKKDLIPCRENLIATNDVSKRVGRYILIYASDQLFLKEYGCDVAYISRTYTPKINRGLEPKDIEGLGSDGCPYGNGWVDFAKS